MIKKYIPLIMLAMVSCSGEKPVRPDVMIIERAAEARNYGGIIERSSGEWGIVGKAADKEGVYIPAEIPVVMTGGDITAESLRLFLKLIHAYHPEEKLMIMTSSNYMPLIAEVLTNNTGMSDPVVTFSGRDSLEIYFQK